MFRIGDFSKFNQVTVKTLRYYDEIGLFKPASVDEFTGYRYYSTKQLPRLNRILALKDLGFSLEQIASMLDDDLPPAEIRGMLKMKQAEIEQNIESESGRLARVEARLRQIEREGKMPAYEIVLKKIEPLKVAAIREVIPNYADIGRLFGILFGYINGQEAHPSGPSICIYYDTEYREKDVDVEATVPVKGQVADGDQVTIRQLPGIDAASVVHQGSMDGITEAYTALMGWIEANGYQIVGPSREIYLNGPGEGIDPADYVTEIQFPVQKA